MSFRVAEAFNGRVGLRHLRLAIALAKHNSLSRAAVELGMSQPTATKLLQDLEAELKIALFTRTNRGVVPNDVGAELVRQAQLLITQLAHMGQKMEDLASGAGGRVVVGTLLSAASRLLPDAIVSLRAARPKVSVEVVEGTNDVLMPRLASGELDFIVGRLSEYRHRDDIVRESLYSEPAVIVARADHPLSSLPELSVQDLVNCEWILPPPETTLRRQIDKAFFDLGLPRPRCVVQSVVMLMNRRIVQATDLLGVWPKSLLQNDPDPSAFIALPIVLPVPAGEVGISRRQSGTLSPAAEAMLEEIRRLSRENSGAP